MEIIKYIFVGLLFFLLTPNILLRLPKNGSKQLVAIVHAFVFSVIFYFYNVFIHTLFYKNKKEGFTNDTCTEGSNDDGGDYILEDENDPNSCKFKQM